MKNAYLIISALLLTTANLAHATDEEVLENTVVQSTYQLMQAKHAGACDALTKDSIQYGCTGLIPPANKLELYRTGCYVGVVVNCPTETARISGNTTSVYALDRKGIRKDVPAVELGLSFREISIEAK